MANPLVQFSFSCILGERLNDPDGQAIFSPIKMEDFFAGIAAVLLFPVKDFFNSGMLYNCDALIIIKEPLNDVRNRIEIDASLSKQKIAVAIREGVQRCLAKPRTAAAP